jgi:succinate dehydrogenase / fumarate reductase cytochrome b subunit
MAVTQAAVRHPKGPPETETARGAAPFLAALVDSSVGAKVVVALTGLGLVTFVVFHMIGNLKMFQGPDAINAYAYFLKHSLGALIWIARAGLLAIFVLHIALVIRLHHRAVAARPVPYQFPGSVQATIASRTMKWTGIVVGLFTLYHLAHFTLGWLHGVNLEQLDGKGRQDVYAMVVAGFRSPVISGLYVAAQLALFVHLLHGIQSAFQTLGLKNRRFAGAIWWLGFAIALTILVGNLAIVLGVLLGWVG